MYMKTTNTLVIGILSITTALAVQAQTFITNGLVAYYPFNGNAIDASGNGNNGTVDGATFTTNRFGQANSAVICNGNGNDYISTSFTPPSGTSSRTFSVWFNTTSSTQSSNSAATSDGDMLSYGGVNSYVGDGIDLGIQSDGDLVLGSSYCGVATSTTWNDGKWHQFVVVIPTNSSIAQIQLFVDGAPQSNYNYYNPTYLINTAVVNPLIFCKSVRGAGYNYEGIFGGIRIYNRPLTTNEVSQLFSFESAPILNVQRAIYLTSSTLLNGSNYQVQASSDLINWTNQGSTFTATNSNWQSTNYWNVNSWNQLFFRLELAQ